MSSDFLLRPLPERPALSEAAPWQYPLPTDRYLDNGMRVVVHHLPGQHIVSGCVVVELPLSSEPRHLEGIATITARCMDEGTATHPGTGYAEELASEGAALSLAVGQAGLQVFLDAPVSRMDRALALFAEALVRPTLAAEDIERHVDLRLAEIEQLLSRPTSFTPILLRAVVFEPTNRAQRLIGGNRACLANIRPDDVWAFHGTHLDPTRATLVLGGDFSRNDPMPLIESVFGPWRGIGLPPAAHPMPTPGPPRIVLADRPGAVQANIALGGIGPDRLDPDWADLKVATHAVGGAFWSRLNRVLREERGFTYGISMGMLPFRRGGAFNVASSFRTDVAAAALDEARGLMSLEDAPLTADEVTDAVSYATGLAPLGFATARGVVDQTASNVLNGLPLGHVNDHLARLRAVTPESATRAYTVMADPARISIVVAGDAELLLDPLSDIGLVPDEVVHPEDIVG
ncbi:Predicted Zn-dependent peptidase [Raineyella antarctica]|uniref:Predicted Zn-dependent peptidase n=1 Tax=Raineyella antarctica TaxID=1577474 RepID=A0A1G6GV31_9ACTN|nr:pitrilysin family protein [Raineyella antarctica]SDB85867.1 Predicted Zn-dependent peptidase [Raineyella antarctica]